MLHRTIIKRVLCRPFTKAYISFHRKGIIRSYIFSFREYVCKLNTYNRINENGRHEYYRGDSANAFLEQ